MCVEVHLCLSIGVLQVFVSEDIGLFFLLDGVLGCPLETIYPEVQVRHRSLKGIHQTTMTGSHRYVIILVPTRADIHFTMEISKG